jgi:predicted DNA-binding transcriptional regulator AlpA
MVEVKRSATRKLKPAQSSLPNTRPRSRRWIRLQKKTDPHEEIRKPAGSDKLLTKRDLLERVGVSYPTIWKMMCAGTFPRSRAIGGKLVWLESEVNEWIAALPLTALKGDDEGE